MLCTLHRCANTCLVKCQGNCKTATTNTLAGPKLRSEPAPYDLLGLLGVSGRFRLPGLFV